MNCVLEVWWGGKRSSSDESPIGVFRGPGGDDDGSGQGTLQVNHCLSVSNAFC